MKSKAISGLIVCAMVSFALSCGDDSAKKTAGGTVTGNKGMSVQTAAASSGVGASGINSVAFDSSGNLYAAGYLNGEDDFVFGDVTVKGSYTGGKNVLLVKYGSDGTVEWAKSVSAAAGSSEFCGVAADDNGNVYAAGYFTGSGNITFGSTSITGYSSAANLVLVKFSAADGSVSWVKKSTAHSESVFKAVAVDSDGNVYAAGNFSSSNGWFSIDSTTINGCSTTKAFVAVKFTSDGAVTWARAGQGNVGSDSYALACDDLGCVYITGCILGNGTVGCGYGSAVADGSGKNAFIAKLYCYNGFPAWMKAVSSKTSDSEFKSVACGSDGSVYAAGYIRGTEAFSIDTTAFSGSYTGTNALLVKIDGMFGSVSWVKTTTSASGDSSYDALAVDSDGSVFAAGSVSGNGVLTVGGASATGSFATGSNAVFARYLSDGTPVWASSAASGKEASGFTSIALDSEGAAYVSGYVIGNESYSFGSIPVTGAYKGGSNAVLVKYE